VEINKNTLLLLEVKKKKIVFGVEPAGREWSGKKKIFQVVVVVGNKKSSGDTGGEFSW
jgi:hypothetical protein